MSINFSGFLKKCSYVIYLSIKKIINRTVIYQIQIHVYNFSNKWTNVQPNPHPRNQHPQKILKYLGHWFEVLELQKNNVQLILIFF